MLEMKFFRPHFRFIQTETLGVRLNNLRLNKPPGWDSDAQLMTSCLRGGCCLVSTSCPALETPWTVACQALLSVGFSKQENWSELCLLLQGIFPTQGSNPHLLRWQADSLPLHHLGNLWGFCLQGLLLKHREILYLPFAPATNYNCLL